MNNIKQPISSPTRTKSVTPENKKSKSSISSQEAKDLLNEADSLFKISKFKEAIKCLDKLIGFKMCQCLDCRYFFSQAFYCKGRCLRGLSRYKESINYFDKTIALNSDFVPAYNYKAFSLKVTGRTGDALKQFHLANKLNMSPTNADEFFNKALTLYGLEKYEKAILNYNKVIEMNPNDAVAYNSKGIALKVLKRFNEAFDCYNKAVEIDPNFAYALNNKGILLSSMNKKEEALECFEKAAKIDIYYADAYRNKGNVLLDLGKYDEAIKCFTNTLELDSSSMNSYMGKACGYFNLKKYKEALECYNTVIEMWPTNIEAYKYKINCLIELKKHSECLDVCNKILKLDPINDFATDTKAYLQQILKKKK